jgi:O-antigen ligase
VISLSISAFIGIFETFKFWFLYNPLGNHLLGIKRLHSFDVRGGQLRASASFKGPIVFGYAVVIGLGLNLYLRPFIKSKWLKEFLFGGLLLGLLATVSRGPWVGFAFLCLVYIWSGREMAKRLTLLTLGFIFLLPALMASKYGQRFIDVLPFVGKTSADTVEYRQELLEKSLIVIRRNPFFGSTNYLETPEMISMTQGQGIIDLVNSFIQFALQYGIVGTFLFASIFLVLLFNLYKTYKSIPKQEDDFIRLGRCFFSILSAIVLMIYTTSSVDYIPDYYWLFFALATSYLYVARQTKLVAPI